MAFYSRIVKAYDQLFPFNAKQSEWIEKGLGQLLVGKRILDMGCGTGSLAINLARKSASVDAFDFDPEMVEMAEEKRPQALNLRFRQGDMLQLEAMYQQVTFDAVVCLGNTMVHLQDINQVKDILRSVSIRLKDRGRFFMQIVNYDRVVDQEVDHLPTIETSDYTFVRNYEYRTDGRIDFATVLKDKKDGVELKSSVPLLPLRKDAVVSLLKEFFSEVNCFGGFDQSEWRPDSFHLVIEAVK